MKSFNTHRIRGNVAARSQHLSIAYAWRYFRTRPPFWCACEASEDVFIYRKYFHLVRAKMLTQTRAPHVRRSQLCILNCRKMHPQVRIRALGGGGVAYKHDWVSAYDSIAWHSMARSGGMIKAKKLLHKSMHTRACVRARMCVPVCMCMSKLNLVCMTHACGACMQ